MYCTSSTVFDVKQTKVYAYGKQVCHLESVEIEKQDAYTTYGTSSSFVQCLSQIHSVLYLRDSITGGHHLICMTVDIIN